MKRLHLSLAAALALAACGGGSDSSPAPSGPTGTTPSPSPSPVNPYAAACGNPLPPIADTYGFGIKVQYEATKNKKVLNASPIIKNTQYCTDVSRLPWPGVPGEQCRTRNEDDPSRAACDHYVSGTSSEGVPGPNWFQEVDGKKLRCGGKLTPHEAPNCSLSEENQYLLEVFGPGRFVACGGTGSNGSCGVCNLSEDVFGVIHNSPAGLCKLS